MTQKRKTDKYIFEYFDMLEHFNGYSDEIGFLLENIFPQ